MDDRSRALLALLIDAALVAVFVVIGRAGHPDSRSDLLVTLWPFVAGLAVGWAAARGWRAPFAILRTGVPAWLGTVAVGMLLRVATGQGVQVAFVVVAAVVVGAFLIGWRALLVAMDRAATRSGGTPGPIAFFLRRR